jgi:hypothetical protein
LGCCSVWRHAADHTVPDVETAEDFAQELEDDGTEQDGYAA